MQRCVPLKAKRVLSLCRFVCNKLLCSVASWCLAVRGEWEALVHPSWLSDGNINAHQHFVHVICVSETQEEAQDYCFCVTVCVGA